jgi:hypothetical protein
MEQNLRDYTDKRAGETEGRINPKLNILNKRLGTLTDVLAGKNVVNEEEVVGVRKAG